MKKVVFLGPSLPLTAAKKLCPDAIFLPPAKCGDVLEVLKINPTQLLLIDGFFEAVPAVWHKELLFVMTKGVSVMGASSMGALRASELHVFGMQAIGQIAKWYRDAIITRDDEVAVLHLNADHHYHNLTEPLVNVRSTLNLEDPAFKNLQERPYRERIWQEKMPAVNQKAIDAEQALRELHQQTAKEIQFERPQDFSATLYFKGLHQQVFCRAPTLPAYALNKAQNLLTQTRLFAPCYHELVKLAKLLYASAYLQVKIDSTSTLALKLLPSTIRWPELNHTQWLEKIVAAQIPYKAFFYAYFQKYRWMPSMTELKRKLTSWQKEEHLATPESVMTWLNTHQYTQEEFEQALVFETLLDYMIDRGNLFLLNKTQELPSTDCFDKAFLLTQGEKYLRALSVEEKQHKIQFLRAHQQDVGLLNTLDFYRNEDLVSFITSCG